MKDVPQLPPVKAGGDNRILIISQFGYSVRKGGARARMRSLLTEMHRLGYETHFAGIRMSEEEKASTLPFIDRWVGNFEHPARPGTLPTQPAAILQRQICRTLHWLRVKTREPFRRMHWLEDQLDQEICCHWAGQARKLQQQERYPRVMLTSVVYTKLFRSFPDPCLRIVDTIDLLSNRRPRLRAKGINLMVRSLTPADERRGLIRAQHILAIQAQEAAIFRQLVGSAAKVYTVGHFAEPLAKAPPPVSFPRLGCIAAPNVMNVQALRWFLREVWPHIHERIPTAEVWLAGGACADFSPQPGVKILGQIPSVEDFYRDCPVFINPVQVGTGLKIKTIEALIHGRPIVTTSTGGEGLDEFHGHGLVLGDSPVEFADAAIRLLADLPAAQKLGESAQPCVQSYLENNRQSLANALKA